MKRYLLAALATMMLVACDPGSTGAISTPAPADYADLTVADERAAIAAEATYQAVSTLGTRLALTGLIDRQKFKALDAKAYDALLLVRAACGTGNASGLVDALAQFNAAIAAVRDFAKE
jgi:hypothetical protein